MKFKIYYQNRKHLKVCNRIVIEHPKLVFDYTGPFFIRSIKYIRL